MKLSFDPAPARSAVLSMDNQAGIVSIYVKEPEGFLGHASSVLERSRSAGMKVIHVQVGFRPKLAEVSTRTPAW